MLFNGEDLSNRHEEAGDPDFYVENSSITGITGEGLPNTFLATGETYDDFVQELDFKLDDAFNSGLQIRITSYEKGTATP